jgi:putative ABC transport system substrate-binding protein
MRRRDFIKVLGGGVAAWPLSARAQRTAMPVIGYLAAGAPNSEARLHDAFVKGLGESGYEIGKNARIEYRWAENQYDRLPSMAADLVRQEVAVLAATTTPAARAAKAATGTIPIVFTTIADPVQIGFVTSLNRPGGNVTGATMLSVEVGPKLVELLHAAVPSVGTMVLLINPTNPNAETQSKSMEQAALKLGLKLHVLNASTERDLDAVFARLGELQAGALIIGHDVLFNAQARQLGALTARNKMPAIYHLVGVRSIRRPVQLWREPGRRMALGRHSSDGFSKARNRPRFRSFSQRRSNSRSISIPRRRSVYLFPCRLSQAPTRSSNENRRSPASHRNDGAIPMKLQRPLIVSFVVGSILASGAIFGLQAAAVPPVYVVVEVNEIADMEAFKEGYVRMGPAAVAEVKLADGRYLVRTGTITPLDGEPPKFFVMLSFQSADKAKAYSASMKELTAARLKLTKGRSFIVEGMP